MKKPYENDTYVVILIAFLAFVFGILLAFDLKNTEKELVNDVVTYESGTYEVKDSKIQKRGE